MFNIHSTEILVVLIVALIVIGPDRLPSAVRTASLWIGRFRRSFYKVKAEIERELNADEIRRQLHNESVLAELEDTKKDVEGVARDAEQSVNKIVNSADFDPGASTATEEQKANQEVKQEEPDKKARPEEKPTKEEVTGAKQQGEKAREGLYGSGRNPKLAADNSTGQEPTRDDVG